MNARRLSHIPGQVQRSLASGRGSPGVLPLRPGRQIGANPIDDEKYVAA